VILRKSPCPPYDADLAGLYLAETRTLIQAVKRNRGRFPADFIFQFSTPEAPLTRSQTVIASRRNARSLPYAFTELGVAMLSAVLSGERAVQMNIVIMRAFVKLREVLASHGSLAVKIGKLDATPKNHASILAIVINDIETLAKATQGLPQRRKLHRAALCPLKPGCKRRLVFGSSGEPCNPSRLDPRQASIGCPVRVLPFGQTGSGPLP
jgi:hypothetical protein